MWLLLKKEAEEMEHVEWFSMEEEYELWPSGRRRRG
jgi:hypothetical protein